MLVLTRKGGEQILIGDGIKVTVQRIYGSRVSISIDAPKDIKIVRGEISHILIENKDPETVGSDQPVQPTRIRS